ncbi:MAG: hypothetical protein HC806_04350 [Anaerolineae bacterium]|nr:hypothetical protein [Anaerolineae bacterium]
MFFGGVFIFGLFSDSGVISQGLAPILMLACFGIVFFSIMAGVLIWALSIRQKRFRLLDETFSTFGLQGQRYLLTGRQFSGTYRGRKINVYFYISGGRYLRSPNLQIYIEGNFRTRLGIGTKNVLTNIGGTIMQKTPLDLSAPTYEGLLIYPLDETWSRRLLSEPTAQNAIQRLVGINTPGLRGLTLFPRISPPSTQTLPI